MEDGSEVPVAALGLRERKKQRTRETIAQVALDLFAEHGFNGTTIKQIADAADVAPRTVSGYFPVKEELVFPDHEPLFDSLEQRLGEREPGETAMEALRTWIVTVLSADKHELDKRRCRRTLIESDHALRTYERGLQERAERIIAAAVAVDLGLPADDLVPRMVGAATMSALDALGSKSELPDAAPEEVRRAALSRLDDAIAFLGAGVRGLQQQR
jgi:AcrR family transcriptional regulator